MDKEQSRRRSAQQEKEKEEEEEEEEEAGEAAAASSSSSSSISVLPGSGLPVFPADATAQAFDEAADDVVFRSLAVMAMPPPPAALCMPADAGSMAHAPVFEENDNAVHVEVHSQLKQQTQEQPQAEAQAQQAPTLPSSVLYPLMPTHFSLSADAEGDAHIMTQLRTRLQGACSVAVSPAEQDFQLNCHAASPASVTMFKVFLYTADAAKRVVEFQRLSGCAWLFNQVYKQVWAAFVGDDTAADSTSSSTSGTRAWSSTTNACWALPLPPALQEAAGVVPPPPAAIGSSTSSSSCTISDADYECDTVDFIEPWLEACPQEAMECLGSLASRDCLKSSDVTPELLRLVAAQLSTALRLRALSVLHHLLGAPTVSRVVDEQLSGNQELSGRVAAAVRGAVLDSGSRIAAPSSAAGGQSHSDSPVLACREACGIIACSASHRRDAARGRECCAPYVACDSASGTWAQSVEQMQQQLRRQVRSGTLGPEHRALAEESLCALATAL